MPKGRSRIWLMMALLGASLALTGIAARADDKPPIKIGFSIVGQSEIG